MLGPVMNVRMQDRLEDSSPNLDEDDVNNTELPSQLCKNTWNKTSSLTSGNVPTPSTPSHRIIESQSPLLYSDTSCKNLTEYIESIERSSFLKSSFPMRSNLAKGVSMTYSQCGLYKLSGTLKSTIVRTPCLNSQSRTKLTSWRWFRSSFWVLSEFSI